MSTQYLTEQHQSPPSRVEHDGMLHPTKPLIAANDIARLAQLGIYRHITEEGDAPLGYSEWSEQSDTDGIYYSRTRLGTEEEREAHRLAEAKSAKYQERLDALLNARNAGFLYNGKRIDSDQDSRILISGAVQLATLAMIAGTPEALAQFAAGLGSGWRHSDGTIAATDAAGMIAIGQALAAHIATCDAVSQTHKAAIEAITTAAECLALDVTTGYPA
jgi:hypothetical protein